eukprot:Seg789.3 transcript_id=Seg789.3/GoldUCD/mRNA.D3Y31 product="hypothetical protein" protein_id=Seg789.3/GoldUCD/D3Y31
MIQGASATEPTYQAQESQCYDHAEYAMHPSLSASTNVGRGRLPIQGLVPSIGPLHVSLNAQETVMQIFHDVFKHIYEQVFPIANLVISQSLGARHSSLNWHMVVGEDELTDDEADGEVIQQQQEDSTQVVPVIVTEEEVMEKLEAIKMKVSSLTEKSKKLKDCSIAQQKIRHCKTCTHSLTFRSSKKETKKLCQVCPDGYCDAKGKKEQCICENHKSPKLAAMNFKVTSPSSNIFHVMIHPQQNAKCKAGFENVSDIISGILCEAFLRGNLNSLSISGLVEKYITIIRDAHDLAKIRIQLHQESSSDLLRSILPVDVISDEEFHVTSLHTFKQMVDRSLQSSEMKAIILQIPSTKNIKFLGIRD